MTRARRSLVAAIVTALLLGVAIWTWRAHQAGTGGEASRETADRATGGVDESDPARRADDLGDLADETEHGAAAPRSPNELPLGPGAEPSAEREALDPEEVELHAWFILSCGDDPPRPEEGHAQLVAAVELHSDWTADVEVHAGRFVVAVPRRVWLVELRDLVLDGQPIVVKQPRADLRKSRFVEFQAP